MATPQMSTPAQAAEPAAATATLEALQAMDARALGDLFRRARWQGPARLEGHPHGHVLAVPGADRGPLGAIVRAVTSGPLNPWQGKSFRSEGQGEGTGTNRVGLGIRRATFVYRTYETASVVDGQPALALDYDTDKNPAFARSAYDELRPVGPGLLLGRGMVRRQGKRPLVLVWFALDTRRQDAAVKW